MTWIALKGELSREIIWEEVCVKSVWACGSKPNPNFMNLHRNERSSPLTTVTRTSELEWILVFKSEYILGRLHSNMFSDVMLPVGVFFMILVIVLCNFAVIRVKGWILTTSLLVNSAVVFSSLFLFIYIDAKLFELMRIGLERRRRRTRSKLCRKLLWACRAFPLTFGPFYDIDADFVMVVMMLVINYTTSLLIACRDFGYY